MGKLCQNRNDQDLLLRVVMLGQANDLSSPVPWQQPVKEAGEDVNGLCSGGDCYAVCLFVSSNGDRWKVLEQSVAFPTLSVSKWGEDARR